MPIGRTRAHQGSLGVQQWMGNREDVIAVDDSEIWMLLTGGLVSIGLLLAVGGYVLLRRSRRTRLILSIQESGEEPSKGPLNGPFVVVTVRNLSRTDALPIAGCAIGIHRSNELFRDLTTSTVVLAPYSLEPGMRFRFWAETAELAGALSRVHRRGTIELVGVCFDVDGGEYRSRPLRFSVEKHLRALARARVSP